MKYWIFTVKARKDGGRPFSPEEILKQRLKDHFWGLAEYAPNRKQLSKGDQVVFYMGVPRKVFAAKAVLGSDSFKLNDKQKKDYSHGMQLYIIDYGVLLDQISIWEKPVPVESVIPTLEFIENKEYWGAYFQGGVRELSEHDFRNIVSDMKPALSERIATSKDVESQEEFALEDHLEEFIYRNWASIDWGSKLELYNIDEQDGRQFPAGTWSIDFLAMDRSNNDLVVIELKRGKTSDAAVGQLLRYIAWVEENLARKGQKVRGIIVTKETDEALSYAVKKLIDVEVKKYKVDFHLL
jgi:hypothetical protein